MGFRMFGKTRIAGTVTNASGTKMVRFLTLTPLRRRTLVLTTEGIEKVIQLYENGATEAAVAKGTGISADEAKAVAEALYVGETDRLSREVSLAGVLEAAAQALRTGRRLIEDGG